jgi:hypothetical protein
MRGIRRRAAALATPPEPLSQEELRRRRRGSLRLVYRGSFDLLVEISAIVGPLAQRVAAAPRPGVFGPEVDEVVAAAHRAVVAIAGMLAEADAARRTAHLHYKVRGRARRMLVELAEQPGEPEIGADALVSGSWVSTPPRRQRASTTPIRFQPRRVRRRRGIQRAPSGR